jgi:CheY-like chemotaxis protein
MRATHGRTILLVDDDEQVIDLLRELLVRQGYAVAAARDGQLALDYLRGHPLPCLILLDLVMPQMDGWEFLTRKARDSKLTALPVVITSGTDASIPSNIPAIRKPFNIADLLNLVREYSLPTT